MEQRKLSIVTICYNSGAYISTTIESILMQKFKDYEYIIIDGASKDNTLDIIKLYENSFLSAGIDLKVYSERDSGIYNAMNKGISKASGEWINFMNAGDRFYNEDVLTTLFSKSLNADIVSGSAIRIFKSHSDLWKPKPVDNMWRLMPFCHQSTFVKTSYHKERLFDESFRLGADYDFFFDSYYYRKKTFLYVDDFICLYDMQGQSTANHIEDARENLKLSKKYNASKSICYFKMRLMYRLTFRPFILQLKDLKRRMLSSPQTASK